MNELHNRPELDQTEIIAALPKACSDELVAVEFIEKQRWGNEPKCVHCGGVDVYKMTDRDGTRNKRFLWRCRGCAEQYTVRIGTVYEESRLPLRHWCFAFWRASTSKKGVSALEISRQCQISYKSALFLMHRIRWAMAPNAAEPAEPLGKNGETIEADETYVGGKPRPANNQKVGDVRRGPRSGPDKKTPVLAIVERDGNIRRKAVADVTSKKLSQFLALNIATNAGTINTDNSTPYCFHFKNYDLKHQMVNHSKKEYARRELDGTVSHVNTAESSFAVLKRGLTGIYHAVSKKHLHRYVSEFDFRWNARKLNDGERAALLIQSATGKRLMYREPAKNS